MTSKTITRSWLSAVVWRRLSASVADETAESNPKVKSVPSRSLSMVLGTPTTGMPYFEDLLRDAEGAVTADAYEREQTQCVHPGFHRIQQFLRQRAALAMADLGGKFSAVRCAENRSSARQ